ncbi:SDR family NAD(P)-dependent oxidoreductase [Arthrobacter wenxiniae]|uniref:SDR family oxidoreductase n=1 Tax=Arthrobacter wenxiniae TaxID=2713570 RepID=A0A7Y7IF21_9MICC|nr:SDR family oxidoreductase [Arthrobacter wenxiniae]NVM94304.1 SDR family oxidoreductase [Arthrobacter wenxiniae]
MNAGPTVDAASPIAVVTGGASGIGAATANRFRAIGYSIVIADLADVSDAPITDLSSTDSVDALATWVAQKHGRCDVLINGAAAVVAGDILAVSESDWTRILDLNVTGIWRTARAFVPLMIDGGAIVNIASGAGLRAIPDMSAYVASKSAVVGLTASMAIDLAPRNIRVNCVCPGPVDTPMARRAQELRRDEARSAVQNFDNYLVKRTAEPDEIAEAVVLLATNRYLTGSTLAVDGGRTLH